MHGARLDRGQIGGRHGGLDLAVQRVARFERDLFALADFDDRRDVRMIAVVAEMGLRGERLSPIDADRVHAALLRTMNDGGLSAPSPK